MIGRGSRSLLLQLIRRFGCWDQPERRQLVQDRLLVKEVLDLKEAMAAMCTSEVIARAHARSEPA